VASANAAGANGASQIQHVVVLMQENRSFDHYFGQLPNEGQPAVSREPANASNPNPLNPGGAPITAFHKTTYCEVADLDHSWNGTIRNGTAERWTVSPPPT
jgi:phospholipase C